jgi:hypothetical protein
MNSLARIEGGDAGGNADSCIAVVDGARVGLADAAEAHQTHRASIGISGRRIVDELLAVLIRQANES